MARSPRPKNREIELDSLERARTHAFVPGERVNPGPGRSRELVHPERALERVHEPNVRSPATRERYQARRPLAFLGAKAVPHVTRDSCEPPRDEHAS